MKKRKTQDQTNDPCPAVNLEQRKTALLLYVILNERTIVYGKEQDSVWYLAAG